MIEWLPTASVSMRSVAMPLASVSAVAWPVMKPSPVATANCTSAKATGRFCASCTSTDGAVATVVLNVAAPRPVAMGALLDAAGLPWAFGAPDPAVLPCVTLDTRRLQALVRLPPNASQPRAMVAEWRNLAFP